ncbi:BON domain-containing protein [Paraburkholderia bannensis]|uniref:BON domain-containing protein n=1 Tax=Paraburkholderia bannensis TaxID=765414 RepID=UPI000488655D|nr:BON domain-containing protein [Paraburkholderia bannensis]
MKVIHVAKATTVAFALMLAMGAHAQASDAQANSMPGATAASRKEMRVANRALTKKVRHALARTKGLDPTHIYVKAVNGAVILTGNCVSQDQINLAGEIAQKVDGVTSVANKLSVKTPR